MVQINVFLLLSQPGSSLRNSPTTSQVPATPLSFPVSCCAEVCSKSMVGLSLSDHNFPQTLQPYLSCSYLTPFSPPSELYRLSITLFLSFLRWFDEELHYIPATITKARFYAPRYFMQHPERYRSLLYHPDHPLNLGQPWAPP